MFNEATFGEILLPLSVNVNDYFPHIYRKFAELRFVLRNYVCRSYKGTACRGGGGGCGGGVNICGIKEYLLVSKSYHCSYRLSYDFFFSYQKVPKVKSACSHSKEVDLKI